MTADGLSPEREERLIGEMLRERAGIDPGRLGPVIDLAALGLVNSAWRNTCVEHWHAEGRMHDGDMMRVNSHMTWRTRQILHRWMTQVGLVADGPLSALDDVAAEDVEWLAIRVFRWLVNPRRRLITGVTLAELARGGLRKYEDDADLRLGGFVGQAADREPVLAWRGPLRTERWPARTGGVIHAGLTWWTGCYWPLMIRLTSTGDRAGSSGNACRPSRPSWRTGSSFGRSCVRARGTSPPSLRRGWLPPVSAICGPNAFSEG